MAVWLSGTRERAPDTVIQSAFYELKQGTWTPPAALLSRPQLIKGLGRTLKMIGNPSLVSDGRGRVWLFFVTTSFGGWSTSSINMIRSSDAGRTWSQPERLVTSPLFNLSTLVRNKGFLYQDGSIGLPAYHELASKYGLVARLDPDGRIRSLHRIPAPGPYYLQPSVVPLDSREAVAFMRAAGRGRRLGTSVTRDGGVHWSQARALDLPNPNKSVAAESIGDDRLLLVFNNSSQTKNDLTIGVSSDRGQSWRALYSIENDPEYPKAHYAYPETFIDSEGDAHVVYTSLYRQIKHVRFNREWLDAQPLKEKI